MSILSICTQSDFVQLQKCLFFSKRGEGGRLTSGTYFFGCFYFFLKIALLSLLFYSKMSFTRKNPDFFPRSLRFNKLTNDFFQGPRCKNIYFLVLISKGSLFSLYYCHSYYPAYLVWNLLLTTHCDKCCTWKSPTIPTFLHQ